MDYSEIRASLQVLGLKELPKDHATLKTAYRRQVKKTHPDLSGTNDGKTFMRVQRAFEVLTEAIDEGDKPFIRVRFGEGDHQFANVSKIEPEGYMGCKYVTALKWFSGMLLSINYGTWFEVTEPKSFVAGNTWIYLID